MTMPQRHWWHELNTWEPEAALAFYGRTLGWEFEPTSLPDGSGYWIARKDGKPVGGIFEPGIGEHVDAAEHNEVRGVADVEHAVAVEALAAGRVAHRLMGAARRQQRRRQPQRRQADDDVTPAQGPGHIKHAFRLPGRRRSARAAVGA